MCFLGIRSYSWEWGRFGGGGKGGRREKSRMLHQYLVSSLVMQAESEERPQQVACSRSENETWGLD